MSRRLHASPLVAALLLAAACCLALADEQEKGKAVPPAQKQPAKKPASAAPPPERFDLVVREDFFAGMFGDWDALERGMKRCENELKKNPKHAEALVWHGGGLMFRAVRAYTQGQMARGNRLWKDGIAEMDRAVALAPRHVGVKIGRAALLLGIAQSGFDPGDQEGVRLVRSALEDYEYVYRVQEPYFAKISEHSRCELIFGMVTGWSQLGDEAKTRLNLERALTYCRDSEYDGKAREALAQSGTPQVKHTCIGCH